jgi:hypothetical protein
MAKSGPVKPRSKYSIVDFKFSWSVPKSDQGRYIAEKNDKTAMLKMARSLRTPEAQQAFVDFFNKTMEDFNV